MHFDADGMVTIIAGTMDFGMGHATTYAQMLSTMLTIPFNRIRIVEGDSDRMSFGGGSGGSRSVMFVGAALTETSRMVIERGKQIAAHTLEASVGDIEYLAGSFVIAGTDRMIGLLELAEKLRTGLKLPPGVPTSLDVDHVVVAGAVGVPQWLPRRRGGDRSADRPYPRWSNIPRSTTSAPSSIRCWSPARCMAASCRASARC